MSFDAKDLRRALGQFPTGVTVITTVDSEGNRVGVTASSFNSVSLDPPLILWSIDKRASSASIYASAEHFVVNVLRNDQLGISNRFASRDPEKFSDIDVADGVGGCPMLPGCVAHFQCRTWQVYEGGDHLIIVGEVLDYSYTENVNALVFHNGRYAVPESHPALADGLSADDAKGFVGDYLLYLLRQTYAAYSNHFYPKLSGFAVTTEEWRVLSLLVDGGPATLAEISPIVSQPLAELRDTVEWLREKSYLNVRGDYISLTESGEALAARLLEMAAGHEQTTLQDLSEEEARCLKSSLKILLEKLS